MLLDGGNGPRGRVLAAESVRRMMRDHLTPEQKAASPFFPGFWDHHGWGYGGCVATARTEAADIGSYGWIGGFGTCFTVDPAAGMTAILLTQRLMRGPSDSAISSEFQTLANRAVAA